MGRFTPPQKFVYDAAAHRRMKRATNMIDRVLRRLFDASVNCSTADTVPTRENVFAELDIAFACEIIRKCSQKVYAEWDAAQATAKAAR